MKIKTKTGQFIVPKEDEGYVLFSYSSAGAFHISIVDGEAEVYIPGGVKKLKDYFEIQGD